jgi:hypothetical protein
MYDEEQEKLRERHGTEELKDPIPVGSVDVNPVVYADTEELLFTGFLQTQADINGVPFSFKSINQHEFARIRVHDRDPNRSWSLFYAYGVYEVDLVNVLVNRNEHLPLLASHFHQLPKKAKQVATRHITALNRRAANAVILAEAYATEKKSRFKWQQVRGMDLMSPSVTGIEGTQWLGMNFAQLVWRALNHYEDQSLDAELAHENALFIGACMAGKGIQKAINQSSRRRADLKRAENDRKIRLLDYVLKGIPIEDRRLRADHMIVASTVEDLVEQTRKQMRGEKDFHDLVVEAIEKRALEAKEKRHQEIIAAQEEAERAFEGRTLQMETSAAGNALLDNQRRAVRVMYPNLYRQQ